MTVRANSIGVGQFGPAVGPILNTAPYQAGRTGSAPATQQPWWCGTSLLSYLLGCPSPAELVQSPEQLRAGQQQDIEYMCSSPTVLDKEACLARGQKAIEQSDVIVAAAAAEEPATTCEYNATVNYPTLAGILGSKFICQHGGDLAGGLDLSKYLIIGGIILAGAFVALSTRRQ